MNHLSIKALICISVFASVATALEPSETAEAQQLQNQYFSSGTHKHNVRNLGARQSTLMAAYFRKEIIDAEAEGKDADYIRERSILSLALLGDDWARNEAVKMFWENSRTNAHLLAYLMDPKIIAIIGEGLFMEEEVYGIGDVYWGTTQRGVAEIFIETLANSPEFSADVINWARRMGRPPDIKMMRDWYRANEAALKAGNFKAVQPGAERAAVPAAQAAREAASPIETTTNTSSAAKPATDAGEVASGVNWYAWVAALLAIGTGGFVWATRRAR